MRFFDRLGNGWKLGITSLRVIRDNPSLMIFPILSGTALLLIAATFFGGLFAAFGTDIDLFVNRLEQGSETFLYLGLFAFYLVNFCIIVFFNVALVHCAQLIFEGREATVTDGLSHSASRAGVIVSWAVLAATVGVVLQMLEERLGALGKIVINLVGLVWAVATFFVVPVVAYENVGPVEAVRRSANIMKEKWGETIGANFSFGVFYILGYLITIVLGILLGFAVHPFLGIGVGILSILFLHILVSAAKTVFLAAAYRHVNQESVSYYDEQVLDNIFSVK